VLLSILLFVLGAHAWAVTGSVVDPKNKPIPGARVCYYASEAELLCATTDESGWFELPDSRLDTLRYFAEGYLPKLLPAVERDKPVVLGRAATLRARVYDAKSGQPVAAGEVEVVYPTGQSPGPFPFNPNGVRVQTLRPGTVRLVARAVSYAPMEPVSLELIAGKENEVRLELVPVSPPEGD
jgi:hypothetical protein